jgi:hypothetical protein
MPENGKTQIFDSGSLALVSVGTGGETLSYFGLFHDFLPRQCPLTEKILI